MTAWHDVIARVRGLSSRLLGRPQLDRLANARSLQAFVGDLAGTAYRELSEVGHPIPLMLDRTTRRLAGEKLGIIADWCGDRVGALAPLFEDEDRRNLRALTRGVAAHAPAEQCVEGLLPTPELSYPDLEELARQPALGALAATLMAWGNPYGVAILDEAARERPSLFSLELALDREYARRATDAAGDAGEPFETYVKTIIDAENARSAVAAASGVVEHDPATLFIEGGSLITRAAFDAMAAVSVAEARDALAHVLAGTVLAPLAVRSGDDAENAVLATMITDLRRAARIDPLSLHVVLQYVLSLRAELHDLARIIWGLALDTPRRQIAMGLVTP